MEGTADEPSEEGKPSLAGGVPLQDGIGRKDEQELGDVSTEDLKAVSVKISSSASVKSFKGDASPSVKSSTQLPDSEFERQCLIAHNGYRKKHHVPPLRLSRALCEYAKEWAETLALEDTLRARPDCKLGENLFEKFSSQESQVLTGTEVVDSWYSTISSYVFGTEPILATANQFSQVVWKGSREFGIGRATSNSGKTYVVANYDPPGNVPGSFIINVRTVEH